MKFRKAAASRRTPKWSGRGVTLERFAIRLGAGGVLRVAARQFRLALNFCAIVLGGVKRMKSAFGDWIPIVAVMFFATTPAPSSAPDIRELSGAAASLLLPSGSGDSHMSEAERKHFLDGEFRIVKDTKEFPAAIVKTLCGSVELRSCMAKPGEPFNASDVIRSDQHIPGRRLIFAGALDDKYFVYYEQGGFALFHKISFFKVLSTGTVTTLWTGNCSGATANIDELRKSIASGACGK